MATPEQFTEGNKSPRLRYFSEEFKRKKVEEIDKNQTRICDICREYGVSTTSVHRWIHKYSRMKKKGIRQVVETESDTKKLIALQEKVRELERIIGQKQILIDFKDKMIELAEDAYKVDIKKKFGSRPFSGFGTTEGNIPGK